MTITMPPAMCNAKRNGDLGIATKEPWKGRQSAAYCCDLSIGYFNVPFGLDSSEILADVRLKSLFGIQHLCLTTLSGKHDPMPERLALFHTPLDRQEGLVRKALP